MTAGAWAAAIALAVLLAGPGLCQAALDRRARRRAMAAALTFGYLTGHAPPAAAAAADTTLTAAETQWLAGYAAWLAGHPQARLVSGNGVGLADQLRRAVPDASDVDIARMLVTVLLALRGFRAYRAPRTAWYDALGAAALDLTRLERSRL